MLFKIFKFKNLKVLLISTNNCCCTHSFLKKKTTKKLFFIYLLLYMRHNSLYITFCLHNLYLLAYKLNLWLTIIHPNSLDVSELLPIHNITLIIACNIGILFNFSKALWIGKYTKFTREDKFEVVIAREVTVDFKIKYVCTKFIRNFILIREGYLHLRIAFSYDENYKVILRISNSVKN